VILVSRRFENAYLVNDRCVTVARDKSSTNTLYFVWSRLVTTEYCRLNWLHCYNLHMMIAVIVVAIAPTTVSDEQTVLVATPNSIQSQCVKFSFTTAQDGVGG
jgi:hypothetical protein